MQAALIPSPSDGFLQLCRTLVSYSEIQLLRGNGNYTNIYLTDGRLLVTSKNIGFYEPLLPVELFCRPHKRIIINRNFIAQQRTNEMILLDGTRLEVARRRRKMIKRMKQSSRLMAVTTNLMTDETMVSSLVKNNGAIDSHEMEAMVNWAKSLKEDQYDFITIFHLTGLQPEIIQSI